MRRVLLALLLALAGCNANRAGPEITIPPQPTSVRVTPPGTESAGCAADIASFRALQTLFGQNLGSGKASMTRSMAYAFVNCNVLGGFANFPQFRVVLIPYGVNNFGPNQEAINAIKLLRSDMLVSCYPGGDSTNEATLLAFTQLISGKDRDLQGQFGSFITLGSIDPLLTQELYNYNTQYIMVAALPDTNTAALSVTGTTVTGSPVVTAVTALTLTPTGDTTLGSNVIANVSSVAGVYPGATISGTGIPASSIIEIVGTNSLTISQNATASHVTETLTIVNAPSTSGIYEGAKITGAGIPSGTTVLSFTQTTITLSQNATASATVSIAIQNVVSQNSEIVASAFAAGVMSSAFPYVPMNQIVVGGLVKPQKSTDWISIDPNGDSEQALMAGLSPLMINADGTVRYLRTRTTWTLNGTAPVTAYFDWQDLVTINDFREDVYYITQNPPFNNNPGGTKASLLTSQLLLNEVIREAQFFEDQGAFQGVQTLAPQFQVQPSITSRGRFDIYIPVNVVPGLMVIAGNIQAVSTIGNFTL